MFPGFLMNYSKIYQSIINLYSRIPYLIFLGYAFPAIHLCFVVTELCELNCNMCVFKTIKKFMNKSDEDYGPGLNLAEIKQILKQTYRFCLITFVGGEPLCRDDFIEILGFAASKRRCSLITNGTLISDEIAKRLIDMRAKTLFHKGLLAIEVTLRGLEKIHDENTGVEGSFKKTIEGIKMILEFRKRSRSSLPLINMRVMISEKNASTLLSLFSLAEDLGVDVCTFGISNPWNYFASLDLFCERTNCFKPAESVDSRTLEKELNIIKLKSKNSKVKLRFTPMIPLKEIIKYYSDGLKLADYTCFIPWSRGIISWNGNFGPCPIKRIGNLRKDKLKDLWNNLTIREFRLELKRKGGLFKNCGICRGLFSKR